VATLNVGDVLTIAVVQMNGHVIVQVLSNGQPAGGLTGPEATRLRNCIDQGHNYTATVLQITGGQVRVRVEHA
jgi:sRNA-binding carbon storage regulator CsrA